MLTISDWWTTLTLPLKVYWVIAIPFTLLFLIQLITTFTGMDADADATGDTDAAIDADTGIEFQFLTLKNLIAFFTIFGWTGIACLNSAYSIGFTILVSGVSGLAMMTIMATLMWFMGKLTDDGTFRMKNAVGKTGTVYLPIPGNRGGVGQVQIKVQGLQTLEAMTDREQGFKTGEIVEVAGVLNGNILLVK